jgi:glucokinase
MSTGHPDTRWLIADIGGTNARFALVSTNDPTPRQEQVLAARDYPDFVAAAEAYLAGISEPRPTAGYCAIANPINGDTVRMTNHDWAFSIEVSRQRLGLERLEFINDFAAQALAMPWLAPDEFDRIGGGEPDKMGPLAVLGPGTGLGVSAAVPSGKDWIPLDSEGGHVTYSPVTRREHDLARTLQARYGHCSAERIVSGPGLVATYEALCRLDGVGADALTPPEVTERATNTDDPRCAEALELFNLALATTASNLAITLRASGGIYLAGGLLPKLGALFDAELFRSRFTAKGRFSDYLGSLPVYLVHTHDHPALRGLAHNLPRNAS